jgi:hypothetical protein
MEIMDNPIAHRVGRVLSYFSSRRQWDSPTPHPQASVPPFDSGEGGGHIRLREIEWGSPNLRRGDLQCGTL